MHFFGGRLLWHLDYSQQQFATPVKKKTPKRRGNGGNTGNNGGNNGVQDSQGYTHYNHGGSADYNQDNYDDYDSCFQNDTYRCISRFWNINCPKKRSKNS